MGVRRQGQPRQEDVATSTAETQVEGRNILELDYLRLGEYAENLVKDRLVSVSRTRIMRLHQEIARIRDIFRGDGGLDKCMKAFIRLKYLLAYTYGRLEKWKEKKDFKEYMQALNMTIDSILNNPESLEENIEKLYMFSEAIVAYHKYYEGLGKEERDREGDG